MKKGWIIAVVCFLSGIGLAGEKDIIPATLTDVTVYSQGAQLYQRANYNVKPGITELIIEGISPSIDKKSIQVKATGNIIIMDSKYSIYYPKPDDIPTELPSKTKREIQLLEDSIRLVQFDLQEIQDEIDVLYATKNILSNNGAVRGQGKVNDSINLLKQTIDYYQLKMVEINKKLSALQRKKTEKATKKAKLEERLTKLRQHDGSANGKNKSNHPSHRISVMVSAKELASGKITVSYVVPTAGWVPMYDLRSDGLTSKINLTYKANVYQNSGLDWENVKLSISTNDPYQNKTKPTIHPWYLDYYTHYRTKQSGNVPSAMKKELEENRAMGYSNALPTSASDMEMDSRSSAEFVQVMRQLTAAEFKIDLPYTIKSDNEQHMVLIKVSDLEANYTYYSVPKLDNGVYLVAEITKLDELGLVPASANIFFDGSYVGETYIDPTAMEDTLTLSLGRDPNLQVKRTLIKEESKEKVIGDKKERSMSYTFEARNGKATDIELVILDQLPLSRNAEIEIEKINLDKGKYDESSGIVEWRFKLKSKETRKFAFSFKVKHAKDKMVYL
jgi:uncharacterized protein (TIGR02231 family)